MDTGDVNGDGIADIVAAGYGGDYLRVILGNSSNSFSVFQTISVGDKPRDVKLADLDFDGPTAELHPVQSICGITAPLLESRRRVDAAIRR